jgi:hypothetical protein
VGKQVSGGRDKLSAMAQVIGALNDADAKGFASELNVADNNGLYIYSRTGICVNLGDKAKWEIGRAHEVRAPGS